MICVNILHYPSKQDVSDGEFSRVKTKLKQVTKQSSEADFKEVLHSKAFVQFGEKHLSTPGARAGLSARMFSDLDPTEVLPVDLSNLYCFIQVEERKAEVAERGSVPTLTGINSRLGYMIKVGI